MNDKRAARLELKYSGAKASEGKKELDLGRGAGRDRAMNAHGKPKDMKATISRLARYVSREKRLIITALVCSLINT